MATGCYDPRGYYIQDRNAFAATALCDLRYSQAPIYAESRTTVCPQPNDSQNPALGSSASCFRPIPWAQRSEWTKDSVGASDVCHLAEWPYYENNSVTNCTQYPPYHGLGMHSNHQATSSPSSMSYSDLQWGESTLQSQISSTASSFSEAYIDCKASSARGFAYQASQDHVGGIAHHNPDDSLPVYRHKKSNEEKASDVPYAPLIYQALLEAPGHRLVLRDIYKWFEANTDKASNPAFKGWQNSVRHNLSMNGAFSKHHNMSLLKPRKGGFIWALEPSAIGRGVQATTRYRQKEETKSGRSRITTPAVRRTLTKRAGSYATRMKAKGKKNCKNVQTLRRGQQEEASDTDAPVSQEWSGTDPDVISPQSTYILTPPQPAHFSYSPPSLARLPE